MNVPTERHLEKGICGRGPVEPTISRCKLNFLRLHRCKGEQFGTNSKEQQTSKSYDDLGGFSPHFPGLAVVHFTVGSVKEADSLMLSAGTLTTAGSMRLSARTKAPSSRVSSSMVAACVCSVEFMSSQDFSASGRSRLSTVSTMACIHGDRSGGGRGTGHYKKM